MFQHTLAIMKSLVILLHFLKSSCYLFRPPFSKRFSLSLKSMAEGRLEGNTAQLGISRHGESSCFLPLHQFDTDYLAPLTVRITGTFPGLTSLDLSLPAPPPPPPEGKFKFEFPFPDDPCVGTVTVEGSDVTRRIGDPVAVVSDHLTLGLPLPEEEVHPVDVVMIVDRSATEFKERKFFLYDSADEVGGNELQLAAFQSLNEFPQGAVIRGEVMLIQIPWLETMKKTKTGFMENDEYF